MRLIPTTMATQHPDNAGTPWWYQRPFISTSAELEECFRCFSELGIDEYNWDWEGKFVDEAVVDRLLHKHFEYFSTHQLGKDKFLTFRIPNPRVETQFRLARAFMVILTSSQMAKSLGLATPIFETILPLTESASEIIEIQKAFQEIVTLKHPLLAMHDSLEMIEVIPLFEQVEKIMDSAVILKEYFALYKKTFGKNPTLMRPYCARSDPALNSGLIPTMFSLKVALSSYHALEKETGVKLFPMVGTGSLPFRGGVAPNRIDRVIKEYAGFKTIIIQSAFRYDYPQNQVVVALQKLHKELPKQKALVVSSSQEKAVREVVPDFQRVYRQSIEGLAPRINRVAREVGRRRERVQHVGLFGYSRGVGNVTLPRAIPFTASLYSLGIPPELIGAGRGIQIAMRRGLWDSVSDLYVNLKYDLAQAGRFLNRTLLVAQAQIDPVFAPILDDITILESVLGISFEPKTDNEKEHLTLTNALWRALENGKDITELITQMGVMRKSLG